MRTSLLSVSIILSLIFIVAPSNAAPTVGKAVSIKQSVKGNGGRRIATASPVFANERIRANSKGLGQFELNDGTRLVVGPGANLTLNSQITGNGSSFSKLALRTAGGAFRFISGNSGSSAYRITTPVATLAIRGTAFDFRTVGGRTYVMLLRGAVRVCGRGGSCKLLNRRCSYIVANSRNRISDPMRPRRGVLNRRQLARIFPFIVLARSRRCAGVVRTVGGEGSRTVPAAAAGKAVRVSRKR